MSNHDDYHKRPGLSASELKAMDQGWREYEDIYIKRKKPFVETEATKFGKLVHTMILEPETFGRYAVAPAKLPKHIDTNDELRALCKALGVSFKSAWKKDQLIEALLDHDKSLQEDIWECVIENFKAENKNKILVDADDYEEAAGVFEAVTNDPVVREKVGCGGLREHPLYWDDATGLRAKMLADMLQTSCILDIKTAKNARQHAFEHDAYGRGYFLQAAHYIVGAKENGHVGDIEFIFIAVEKKRPYRVRCYKYDERSLSWSFNRRTDLILECKARKSANNWIEGDDGEGRLNVMSLPAWRIQDEVNWDELNEVDE